MWRKKRVNDSISRQAALDALGEAPEVWTDSPEEFAALSQWEMDVTAIKAVPSAEPEIIRCKDCRWWNKYGDHDMGYCMAAKHGYWSEHWEISIMRTYKGDFYCADAEMRGEQDE